MKYTYEASGVDVRRNDEFTDSIKQRLSLPDWVVREPTGYAAILQFTQPPIVVTADGIGSKLLLHARYGRWVDAARDLIAMNYNDILCVGGRPLAFVDYLGVHHIDKQHAEFISALISELERLGMALVAGETAELPSIYTEQEWDVAGFCVGVLERRLPVETITEGDAIIGLPASGFHSNGWSLLRKIIDAEGINIESLNFDLLSGTRIYNTVPSVFGYVKGVAHVTGGGIVRALRRLLGGWGCRVALRLPEFIKWVLRYVELEEAMRTFNMGYGLLLVTPPELVDQIVEKVGGELLGHVALGSLEISVSE